MKENTINLNEIDLNNQTALSILTAASKQSHMKKIQLILI